MHQKTPLKIFWGGEWKPWLDSQTPLQNCPLQNASLEIHPAVKLSFRMIHVTKN